MGLSALRQRAAGEGWRRSDQGDPEPRAFAAGEVPPEALDDYEPLDAPGMAELSRKRARRAMLEGEVREAQSWTRVHESWRKIAAEDGEAARRAALEAETAEQAFARRAAARDCSDRLMALERADREARAPALSGEDDVEELDDLHEVHDLHAEWETKSARPPLTRRRRLGRARAEAWKARQRARDGP